MGQLMFTRPLRGVEVEKQGQILNTLAQLAEDGVVQARVTRIYNPSEIKEVHQQQESGSTLGKLVVRGF